MKNIIIIFALCLTLKLSANDGILMKIKLQKGEQYTVHVPIHLPMNMSITVNEEAFKDLFSSFEEKGRKSKKEKGNKDITDDAMPENMNMSMDLDLTYDLMLEVIEVKTNAYVFKAHYENVSFNQEVKSVELEDELTEEDKLELDKIKQSMKNIENIPFNIEISDAGTIIEITNYHKITDALLKDEINGNDNELENEEYLDESSNLVSEKGLTDVLNGILFNFPKVKLNVGDSWNRKDVVNDKMIEYTVLTKYTIKEINDNDVVIESDTKMFIEEEAKSDAINLDGIGNGSVRLKLNNCFEQDYIQNNLKMNLMMNILGMQMNIDTNTSSNYFIKKNN